MSCSFKYAELFRETNPELADSLTQKGLQVWSLIKDSKLFKEKNGKYSLASKTTAKRQKQIDFIESLNDFVYLDGEDVVVDLSKVDLQNGSESRVLYHKSIYEDRKNIFLSNKEKDFGLRNIDGSRKRFTDKQYNKVLELVKSINKDQTDYSASVIKIMGEKGDNRVYYAASISLKKQDNTLEINKLFKEGDSTKQVLEKIANSDHYLNKLAKKLLEKTTKNTILRISEDDSFLGRYTASNDTIQISRTGYFNLKSKGDLVPTILHEILHSLTFNELKSDSKLSTEFEGLFNHLINYKDKIKNTYPLINKDEFLVALFTDKNFIQELKQVPPTNKGSKNLWDELVDFFEKLFNFSKDSFYKEALSKAIEIIEQQYLDDKSWGDFIMTQADETELFSTVFNNESAVTINSNLAALKPDITDNEISVLYENYKNLMNLKREGKEMSFSTFKTLTEKYQVINYKDTYIFGQYDAEKAVFVTRVNSSPSSKELLAEVLPRIVGSGIDLISFVPKDVADKYQRSGYTVSTEGFDYNFKGEEMVKYAAASNDNIFNKLFGKTPADVTSEELVSYNEKLELKYTPVSINSALIEQAGTETSKVLETYLSQFGIGVKEVDDLKILLKTDELGVFDVIQRLITVKDKKDLPPIAGEVIAYMMQYNPLVQDIINELVQTNAISIPQSSYKLGENGQKIYNYKSLEKKEFLRYIGNLIALDLDNKLKGNYSKSLIDKIKQLIKTFFDYITKTEVDKINKNIGTISNNIIQQNKHLITASLYKPGAFGKPTKQVSIEDALVKDQFGADIIYKISKEGFILTGSTALSEQGTILRPDENPLHDIDWVSPFSRKDTINKFKNLYPDSIKVRNIYGDGYTTDSFIIAPEGFSITDFTMENYNGKIIVKSYNVVNKQGEIVGTYNLQKQQNNNQNEEVVTGVEAKIIDFFSYDEYQANEPFEYQTRKGDIINLANWKDIFKAKIKYARYKDIWDFNRFIPNDFKQQDLKEKTNKPISVYGANGEPSTLYPKIVEYIKENGFNPNEPYYKEYLEAGYIKDYIPEELAIVHYNLAYPNEDIEPSQLFETLTALEKQVLKDYEIDPSTISTAEAKLIVNDPNEAIRQTMTYYKTMRGNNTEIFYEQVREKQDKLYKDYGCM